MVHAAAGSSEFSGGKLEKHCTGVCMRLDGMRVYVITDLQPSDLPPSTSGCEGCGVGGCMRLGEATA
jgi:hypothetical protein